MDAQAQAPSGSILSGSGALRRRHLAGKLFEYSALAATLTSAGILAVLLAAILYYGASRLRWSFFTNFDSQLFPEDAGILPALVGSLYLIVLTALFAVPVGVGTAIYLEEYAGRNLLFKVIKTNISNLAGVPSIVYGILGLAVFVRFLMIGQNLLAASLTLSLVILPIIIIAAQEAIRAVPDSIRHASYALGATRWQTTWRQVLPAATPGIMTGVILALSRAVGEAAPLIAVGIGGYVSQLPTGPISDGTALPLQIFSWTDRPQEVFRYDIAGAGIIVLLVFLFTMNAAAVFIRYRFGRRHQV